MTSTDDLDDILEGLSYEDLQALSDEIDPEVGYCTVFALLRFATSFLLDSRLCNIV
jgi:hypothetical protein